MSPDPTTATCAIKILICDLVGLSFDIDGSPDHGEIRAYVTGKGGVFHDDALELADDLAPGLHFFYQPHLSTGDDLIAAAGDGQYDAVIAAATFLPAGTVFPLGGVRIGAGTGNMGSTSWGGGTGEGGTAPLMNTPGINSRATAQMAMKAILKVLPDLPVDWLDALVSTGDFDTGRQLRDFPTSKLEGKTLGIIGYGNIGRELAKLGRAFGMRVVIHARPRHRVWIEAEGFVYAETPVAAATDADVLSVHIGLGSLDPVTKRYANAGLIDAEILDALAQGAVLVNYDRGELVDVDALAAALESGRVRHAAIDADLFRDAATGDLSGPMLPYLALVEAYGDRLELLPHAAADTDHPSRVAGAKQAIDQIFDAVLNKRVVNRKGSLPEGYTDGGAKLPAGIGPVLLNGLAGDKAALAELVDLAKQQAATFDAMLGGTPMTAEQAEALVLAMTRYKTRLEALNLTGPYRG